MLAAGRVGWQTMRLPSTCPPCLIRRTETIRTGHSSFTHQACRLESKPKQFERKSAKRADRQQNKTKECICSICNSLELSERNRLKSAAVKWLLLTVLPNNIQNRTQTISSGPKFVHNMKRDLVALLSHLGRD